MSNEFSYERYLAGEKVITRSGLEVLHIEKCKEENCACEAPLFSIFKNETGRITGLASQLNGQHYVNEGNSGYDLIMAPKTIDLYIAIRKGDGKDSYETSLAHTTIDEALKVKPDHMLLTTLIAKITVNTDTWEQVL